MCGHLTHWMLDISDVLEAGVRLIVYADDIVVYVSDPDEAWAYKKLQDSLTRMQLYVVVPMNSP